MLDCAVVLRNAEVNIPLSTFSFGRASAFEGHTTDDPTHVISKHMAMLSYTPHPLQLFLNVVGVRLTKIFATIAIGVGTEVRKCHGLVSHQLLFILKETA